MSHGRAPGPSSSTRLPAPDPPRRSRTTARARRARGRDRKSTRLNSSHSQISYAVFCLKKKTYILNATVLFKHIAIFVAQVGFLAAANMGLAGSRLTLLWTSSVRDSLGEGGIGERCFAI